ncbi:DUF2231 domain-containing protein [Streptomyces sp. NPDC006662]|uniref:DUF2231 domain-containing protein n=1 Tax=Streptomyces sp. NPDC006662 TaxID=3156902 RepID=UPI0033D8B3A1
MGLDLVNGLPAHILLVHVVVVLAPLAAVALIVCTCFPRAAHRIGLALPVLALAVLVSVPLTTEAGEWLEHHVERDPLIRRHAELGDGLLPWVLALFVLATAVWWVQRRRTATTPASTAARWTPSTPVRAVAIVLALLIGAGTTVQVYRIGDSGARAAWHDGYSAAAHPGSHR